MRTVSFTKAEQSLKSVLDQVVDDKDFTVITRQGNDDTVLMSLDYFNGYNGNGLFIENSCQRKSSWKIN